MNDFIGQYMVPLYFITGTLTTLFLSYKYLSQKASVFRNFGIGLGLYSLAFAIWAVAVITKPTDLEPLTLIGVVPFAVAHIFFLLSSTHKVKASARSIVLVAAFAYLAGLLLLRAFVYQSHPAFSSNGLFYFHADPVIVALYIGAFAAALLPAINAVASKMKDQSLRIISQLCFTALAIGGVVLLTSYDDHLQTINGWVMGVAFILLLVTYSSKKIK